MAEYDQITASTRRYVRNNPKLVDSIFQKDPFLAYLRLNVKLDFPGGRQIEEPFIYNGMIGGPYAKGKEFDISERQVEQNLQFQLRFWEENVTLSMEDVKVLNRGGDLQLFSLVKSRMQDAYMSLGAHMALGLYLNGQNANYTTNFNGLAEMLNDNSTVSWDGNTYTTYGTITRGGSTGTALNSAPTNVSGAITYKQLETTYMQGSFGSGEYEPNLGVTTAIGISYVKTHFQPQQRFETQDPKIGFRGLAFNNAIIIGSRYAPGSYLSGSSGTADPIAVTMLTEMSNGAITSYPSVQGGSSAETFFWINARQPFVNFYVSRDPMFGGGFTGWKGAPGNTKISGQVLMACAFTGVPRYHVQLYGITG